MYCSLAAVKDTVVAMLEVESQIVTTFSIAILIYKALTKKCHMELNSKLHSLHELGEIFLSSLTLDLYTVCNVLWLLTGAPMIEIAM